MVDKACLAPFRRLRPAQDLQGTRAYQAARAGIEWGLYKLLRESGSCTGNPAAPNSFTLSTAPTLAGFTVSVYCTPTTDPGGYGGPTVYDITSTACNQPNGVHCPNTINPSNLYIERRLKVKVDL